MCAGRVLRRAQLRRLHVERGAAAKHRPGRHRIWQDGGRSEGQLENLRTSVGSRQTTALCSVTWHDDKGTLGLHRNQTGTEDAGGVGSGDAAHPTRFLQSFTERLQVPPAQQNAPVWDKNTAGCKQATQLRILYTLQG